MTETAFTPSPREAIMQRIASLSGQRQLLEQAQTAAETELAQMVANDYARSQLSDRDVCVIYQELRRVGMPRFSTRWDAAVPANLRSKAILWTAVLAAPDDDGIWRGEFPFDSRTRTPTGATSVVYVLFDDKNEPCYVGSSKRFRYRLKRHARSGKAFTRWMAYPCADRDAAYDLEVRLLAQHKPYLNRKVGR